MKRSSFRHYPLSIERKRQMEVQSFLGVDYSNKKFLAPDGSAIDAKNFIYRDGTLQKRHGVEQLLAIRDFSYIPADFSRAGQALANEVHSNAECKAFNGLWSFDAEDGKSHLVAHVGKLLYEIKETASGSLDAEPITVGTAVAEGETKPLAYEFEDYQSSAFIGGRKMWFLGGNKYMCLRFLDGYVSLFAVENSQSAPVPTTTISITYSGSVVSRRTGLDGANLLNKMRKNTLISGTGRAKDEKTETTFFEYTLDAPLITEDSSDMAKIEFTIEEQGEID